MVPTAPCGTWPSPVDAALAASHSIRPDSVGTVGDEVWWVASRPEEGGRQTLVRRRAGGAESVALPAPWNVRTKVHEYGGRPWTAVARTAGGPLVVFAHGEDQRLYAWEPDGAAAPRPLTPVSAVGGGLRWADPVLVGDEVWCVLEEFTGPGPLDVRRVIAAVPLDGGAAEDRAAVRELTDGKHRFVTGPRLSPDGTRAAWLAWDHPRMPWDGTELRIAQIEKGRFVGARTLLGGPGEAVAQVEWAADGALLAVTERTGWWNLHRVDPGSGEAVNLCAREEEFGGPLWQLGARWFVPLAGGLVAVLHGFGGKSLGVLDPETGVLADAAGPWTEWTPSLDAHGPRVVGVAASPETGFEVVELDTRTGRARVIGARHEEAVDPAYCSRPVARTFAGKDGREVYAHVHLPRHPERAVPEGELPPFVVRAHGGPTGRKPLALDLEVSYFTSRGIGVVDVNYGGSTGYGRAYRERLRGQWGVVDVEDCAAVAEALVAEGVADPARLAVQGGSAGGWTAALSLVTTDLYACGTLLYPALDPTGWADGGTHDFESRYTESLIGPPDEVPERYRERSALRRAGEIKAPFLLLQGLEDPVCPAVESERLARAAAERGLPHAYLAFEGEGHGFRRAETLVRALEAELGLYARVFGFAAEGVPELGLTR